MHQSNIILLFVLSLICLLPTSNLEGNTLDLNIVSENAEKGSDNNIIEFDASEQNYNISRIIHARISFLFNKVQPYRYTNTVKKAINSNNILIPIRHLVCIYRE